MYSSLIVLVLQDRSLLGRCNFDGHSQFVFRQCSTVGGVCLILQTAILTVRCVWNADRYVYVNLRCQREIHAQKDVFSSLTPDSEGLGNPESSLLNSKSQFHIVVLYIFGFWIVCSWFWSGFFFVLFCLCHSEYYRQTVIIYCSTMKSSIVAFSNSLYTVHV